MGRKTILVETLAAPKRVVQQIKTRSKTTAICPLCRTRFKKGEPTVLIDLVRRLPLTGGEEKLPEYIVRISICETCAQPVIEQRKKAIDGLIAWLAELAVDSVIEVADSRRK